MRHRFHAICPYFAMFPESFVEKHLVYSKPGDLVLDPFSGRGTTGFQALLSGRRSISSDVSAVAACISKAKTNSPSQRDTLLRLTELETRYVEIDDPAHEDAFYQACFAPNTLRQLTFLRSQLDWKQDDRDCFLAALAMGCLHGESHRSKRYFSNRMPRTIATKPDYSIRWWNKYNYQAPHRNVFDILRAEIAYRFDTGRPSGEARVALADVRDANSVFHDYKRQVRLVITSPPYLDTTHFQEDQWLRNWFVGGNLRPTKIGRADDRHTSKERYWQFLTDAWAGICELLSHNEAIVVVRIGGSKIGFDEAREGILSSLAKGTERQTTLKSASVSEIVRGQLRSFRPSALGTKREYDIVVALS